MRGQDEHMIEVHVITSLWTTAIDLDHLQQRQLVDVFLIAARKLFTTTLTWRTRVKIHHIYKPLTSRSLAHVKIDRSVSLLAMEVPNVV